MSATISALGSSVTRGLAALGRRPAASLWATLAVAAALCGVAAIDLAARHVDAWSQALRAQASMVVYLDESATADHAGAVAAALADVDGVDAAVVVSTAEAADRLRAALGAHDALLEGVDPATLPLSIEVTLAPGVADVIGASPLLAELRAAGAVEDLEVTRDYTAPLGEALARFERLAWALFAIIGLAAALIVAAAVRLRVGSGAGRGERAALAWLGAGAWFVRGPALVAGATVGVLGAALALALAVALVDLFRIDVAPALGGAPAVAPWPLARAGVLLAAGGALGLLGGALAARRAAIEAPRSSPPRARPLTTATAAAVVVAVAGLTMAGLSATARADGASSGIGALLDRQREVAARAHAQVEAKRQAAAATRAARVRAAYKLLRGAGSPLGVAPERRLAVARSRATARLLLARDRAEVGQLADEAALLAAAIARIDGDRAAAPAVASPPPGALTRPVAGAIARRFGTLVHERTGAVLARRGLDLEVAAAAPVVAPADGVVRYAGPIRGLDHGVILDHGPALGGVISVIAKLAPPDVRAGDRVTRGAPLGRPAKRRVYLEVRVPVGPGGTPVDPEPLLAGPPR